MSFIHSYICREQGLGFAQNYNFALSRLQCRREDVYKGISPNPDAVDYSANPPIFACRFCSTPGNEHILALANEDGKIALQDTNLRNGSDETVVGIQAHFNAIFDIAWMPREMKFVTASGDHSARLWDVSLTGINEIKVFKGHERSIKCAVFRDQDKAVFATGARDGAIFLWDTRANHTEKPKPDNFILHAHDIPQNIKTRKGNNSSKFSRDKSQSITALAFQDDTTLLSCSSGDGLIKVWDIRKNYTTYKKEPTPKHVMKYSGKTSRNGFTSLNVCPAGITLYASCMDNIIYAYNISSYNPKPVAEYFGHENSTFYVKACLSPDGKYLGSGSSDENAYIWETKKPGLPLLKLCGHTDEVTCIAWSTVSEAKIVTCSDDSCYRIWQVGTEDISDDQKKSLCGYAETHPKIPNKVGLNLETTPTISKKLSSVEYTSESDITPGNTPVSLNGSSSINALKRKLDVLSPIEEGLESSMKRASLELKGARRLFSPLKDKQPGPGTLAATEAVSNFSPTANLPSFVIDGTAPHLSQWSPQKLKENVDWLTRIRKERYGSTDENVNAKPISPKASLPVRRKSRANSTEPKKILSSPSHSLLQFFKSAVKESPKS